MRVAGDLEVFIHDENLPPLFFMLENCEGFRNKVFPVHRRSTEKGLSKNSSAESFSSMLPMVRCHSQRSGTDGSAAADGSLVGLVVVNFPQRPRGRTFRSCAALIFQGCADVVSALPSPRVSRNASSVHACNLCFDELCI